jgi:hypothetical protein
MESTDTIRAAKSVITCKVVMSPPPPNLPLLPCEFMAKAHTPRAPFFPVPAAVAMLGLGVRVSVSLSPRFTPPCGTAVAF